MSEAEIKRKSPERLLIDLTSKCNLRCRYCCFFSNPAEAGAKDLPTEEWRRFFREAGQAGVMEITLRGGEVLLRPDFAELVRSIVDHRMRFRLLTNGALLTEALAAFLAATNRCNVVKLSLDGPPAIHDPVRGVGSQAAALKAIDLCRSFELPLLVTAAIHRGNYRKLPEIAAYLLKDLALPLVTFSAVTSCADDVQWSLTSDQMFETMAELTKIEKEFSRQLLSRGMIRLLRRWRQMLQAVENQEDLADCSFGGCVFFRNTLAVRADGMFVPCLELTGQELGRINRDPLERIWQESELLRQLRQAADRPERYPECADCRFRRHCRGGCPAKPAIIPSQAPGCLLRFLETHGDDWF